MPGEAAIASARAAADAERGARPTFPPASSLAPSADPAPAPPFRVVLAESRVRARVARALERPSAPEPFPIPPRRALELWDALFRDHPGALARERCRAAMEQRFDRDDAGVEASSDDADDAAALEPRGARDLVYGEFSFNALLSLFKTHAHHLPAAGATLADLGSGIGRPVFAAAVARPDLFARVVGVEIIPELHRLAAEVARLYEAEIRGSNPSREPTAAAGKGKTSSFPPASVLLGDFLAAPGRRSRDAWADADVVLVNSACFGDATLEAVEAACAASLKPGALVVTLRRGFGDLGGTWELLERKERRMSWGASVAFVHRRRA